MRGIGSDVYEIACEEAERQVAREIGELPTDSYYYAQVAVKVFFIGFVAVSFFAAFLGVVGQEEYQGAIVQASLILPAVIGSYGYIRAKLWHRRVDRYMRERLDNPNWVRTTQEAG